MNTLSEILKGCWPGRTQAAGNMQMVPLLSDMQSDTFSPPTRAEVDTRKGYGHLLIKNPDAKVMIIPPGAAYLTDEKAQNHAMTVVGLVKAKKSEDFNTAACIQQTQGGSISPTVLPMRLLPLPVRQASHSLRLKTEFNKLWPAISKFNASAGQQSSGHLELFFDAYAENLETFVAQFEPVPGQVGAVFLVDGRVVGVERTPSEAYWQEVWRPIVRDCYGSFALVEAKTVKPAAAGKKATPPYTRVPLKKVARLEDLAGAVRTAEGEERKRVGNLVNQLSTQKLSVTSDDAGTFPISAVSGELCGQVVHEDGAVVYASLVCKGTGVRADWLSAEEFAM